MGYIGAPGETVVRVRGLTKAFGKVAALRSLDLDLRAGEVFGFLGPNGAGKTTAVKLLLGMLRPDAGTIEIFGQPLAGHEREALAGVGAIVEAPAFYPYLTGWDNLAVLARLGGIDAAKIDAAIDAAGLAGARRQRFSQYSVGMKQRLGIASVLLRDPRLIVLDEPTTGLDPEGQRDVDSLIRRLADEGRCVFLSSHLMGEVEQICDRVAIMRAGEKLFEGDVRDLLKGSGRLAVRAPDLEEASSVLRRLPWVAGVISAGDQLLVEAPPERAGEVAAALAGAGIFLTELRPHTLSMEALYHDVMSREAA